MSFKFNPFTSNFDMVDQGGSLFLSPVALESDLTLLDPDGAVRVVLATDRTYVYDATLSKWHDSGLSAAAFSAVADAKGITVTPVTTGNITQNNITLTAADATNPGGISVGSQSFGGNKTFINDIQVDGTAKANTIDSKTAGATLAIGGTNAAIVNIGNSSAIVNLIGDVNIQNVTNLDVTNKLITTNAGGAAGSGSDSGVQVEENGSATAYVKTSVDRNSYRVKAPNKDGEIYLSPSTGAFNAVISSSGLSSNQTLTIPDITGTAVVTEGAQTINGNKTLTGTANFSALTASTPLKLDASKNVISADIELTTDVNGILPVANGGTNSSTALANSKVMVSTGGSIVESSTTTTELSYLDATSSIQTQIDTKLNKAGDTMTGVLTLTNGSVGTPAINLGDAATGFYRSALNNIAVSANGSLAATFNGTGIVSNGLVSSPTFFRGPLLVGGFLAASTLTIQPTSGVGTAGSDIIFKVGNNGATEVGRFKQDGTATFNSTVTAPTFIGALTGTASGNVVPVAGDILKTTFTAANNVSVATDITGAAFANATTRSFTLSLNAVLNATTPAYEFFTIRGIQRGSDWSISQSSVGDSSGVVFSITTAGQLQYTSANAAGFVSLTFNFKADTIGL